MAAQWYQKAAEQGHAQAQCNLAWDYDNGCGVEEDPTMAVQWYQKAADQGHAQAQFNLGWDYNNGCGIEKDPAMAVYWYRKAAEQGGVHPVYIDQMSSSFALKIEQISSPAAGPALIAQIAQGYCRLVRTHATKKYSAPIQNAIFLIEGNLSNDLSLSRLAKELNVNSSYLSTLFKKETGKTVTDYIAHRRIGQARHLLDTTRLQVQTVGQHCGFEDVHYFSKVFKRLTGMTPKQYRTHSAE